MESNELKLKVMDILHKQLPAEEFNRVCISIGESNAMKEAKTLLKVEQIKANNLEKQKALLQEQERKTMTDYVEARSKELLDKLADYLSVKGVVMNPFTLNVALHLDNKDSLTPKQKQSVLRDNVIL